MFSHRFLFSLNKVHLFYKKILGLWLINKRYKKSKRIRTEILNHKDLIIFEHPSCVLKETELFFHFWNLFVHDFLFVWWLFFVWVFFINQILLEPTLLNILSLRLDSSSPSAPRLNCIKFGLPIPLFGGVSILFSNSYY